MISNRTKPAQQAAKAKGSKLGRALRPYGIKASPQRTGNQTNRYYLKEHFLEAFERYIPD